MCMANQEGPIVQGTLSPSCEITDTGTCMLCTHTYLEVAKSVSRAESDMAGSGDHQHHEYVFLKKIERAL